MTERREGEREISIKERVNGIRTENERDFECDCGERRRLREEGGGGGGRGGLRKID